MMNKALILASGSPTRATMLQNAGVLTDCHPARIDEEAIRAALLYEQATPRDIADALAEAKAAKVSSKWPGQLVLGADQILELDGAILSKAPTPGDLREQLIRLSGQTHRLLSAAVIYQDRQPIWRHISTARLTMHLLSPVEIDDYVTRNWDEVRYAVGGYHIEGEGVRLMSQIEGDYFTILGLPLIPLLNWLRIRQTSLHE